MEKKSFSTPFSKKYWVCAFKEVKNVRSLAFAALMIAAYVLLGMLFVPVGESLRVTFKFIAAALLGLVCGPVLGICAGIISDTVGFMLFPTGLYFPGYMLSAVLSFLIFALFFYKQKTNLWRIIASKAIVNYGVNVALGTLWNVILIKKAYTFFLGTSLIKNSIMLPIEIIMLVIVFKALKPVLQKMNLIPQD